MNRFFHYKERGGTLSGEILAGLGMLFLSVCGIFVNIQLIAKLRITGEYASATASEVTVNGEIYAQAWFLSMMIAFVGSLLLGVITRLPLVQIGGLGLSTVLVSMVGASTGLSYYNLLYVCFISSIVYTVLVAVPGVKKWIFHALPQPVRRALPAAAGLLMAWIAIQLTGIFTVNGSDVSVYGAGEALEAVNDSVSLFGIIPFSTYSYSTDKYHPLLLVCAVCVLVTFVFWLVFRQRTKRPFLYALLCGTLVFFVGYLLGVCVNFKTMKFTISSLWGRLYMVGSEDAMIEHLSTVLNSIKFGRIFSSGSDFSAYKEAGGNVALLFATTILNFVFINMYEAESVLQVEAEETGVFDANEHKGVQLTLICNGVMNIIAPLYGGVPVTVGSPSCAAAKDGAKSGLASIVAAIGFAISAFIWIIPFLFSTATSYTIVFEMYGHYGTVMQLMCETSFAVADTVMVILGLSMAAHSLNIDWKNLKETSSLAATVAGTLLMSNLAAGVAAGTLAYVIVSLSAVDPAKRLLKLEKKQIKKSKKAEEKQKAEGTGSAEPEQPKTEEIAGETQTAPAVDAAESQTLKQESENPGRFSFKGVTIQQASWAVVSIVLLVFLMR
ncbi:MAG: hypothetical protein LUH20_13130 [Lachnospiraceae bacterium]|nr:hypothetical protein [Lachnospiraceae bacterium]